MKWFEMMSLRKYVKEQDEVVVERKIRSCEGVDLGKKAR